MSRTYAVFDDPVMRAFVHDRSWCWCGGVVYDPTTHQHEPECKRARAALARGEAGRSSDG